MKIIRRHPWSSLRDALLIAGGMTFAVMFARAYDIFAFLKALADPKREISPAEWLFLAGLLALSLYVFYQRRMREDRDDADNQAQLELEIHELRQLAMQDPLTRLPNRRALLSALEAVTSRSDAKRQRHALFVMDLNGFKRVNDAFGHAIGDEVLQIVAERFRRVSRPSDLLARLGGDEFALLSCNVDGKTAAQIGTRFASALTRPISTSGRSHDLGVAIGAALIPDHLGESADSVLRHADVAMYRAKAMAGSAVVIFDPKLDVRDESLKAVV